jgi:hypothetical protein
VTCGASVAASAATVERSLKAPPMRIIAPPEPVVSTARGVPSAEATAAVTELVIVIVLSKACRKTSCPLVGATIGISA